MMANYLEHVVLDLERWDTLAYHYYGDANQFGRIIDANPALAVTDVLVPGTTLLIPIIAAAAPAQLELPPWLS